MNDTPSPAHSDPTSTYLHPNDVGSITTPPALSDKYIDAFGFTTEDAIEAGVELTSEEEAAYIKSERIAASAPQETTEEISANANEIFESSKNSLDFLAAMAMPTVFQYLFPPVFLTVWSWLTGYVHRTRDFSQLVLGLPRGFGKSTLMKIFILYCILFTKKKFILVIAARAELAENIISDVIDMLEEPNIKTVFGDWKLGVEKDTQGIKKFGYRGRNIILAGLGSGTSLRGLNLKNERPDVMLFDDVQTRECADSLVESAKLLQWMIGTAMKAKSPLGCLYIFVGNMYPTKHSILRNLKTNPKWIKFIAGGILADGTSLWEELQPIAQLVSEYESDLAMGHPEIFFSEVLNDENASANHLVDFSKLPDYPVSPGDIPAGNFIVIDPSNDKINSDAVSIGYFEVHDTLPVLMELVEDRLSPGATIKKALDMALSHNCRLIAVESNAYQYSLLYWFGAICEQYGITGINIVDLYSGSRSKNARILDMFKSYSAGEIFVSPSCRNAVHSQISGFNPMKRENTDGLLDLLTYAPKTIELYGEFIISTSIIDMQEYQATGVLSVEHTSSF
jgi:hypothetical protein